jgi:hypothetical protein
LSPLIARTDKYLAGWQNQNLNARGRAMLKKQKNSVLDGAAAYLKAANQMPQGVLDALDARRRAFMWTCASGPMFRSPQNSKFFHSLSITSIFSRLHGVLNVGKKNI